MYGCMYVCMQYACIICRYGSAQLAVNVFAVVHAYMYMHVYVHAHTHTHRLTVCMYRIAACTSLAWLGRTMYVHNFTHTQRPHPHTYTRARTHTHTHRLTVCVYRIAACTSLAWLGRTMLWRLASATCGGRYRRRWPTSVCIFVCMYVCV